MCNGLKLISVWTAIRLFIVKLITFVTLSYQFCQTQIKVTNSSQHDFEILRVQYTKVINNEIHDSAIHKSYQICNIDKVTNFIIHKSYQIWDIEKVTNSAIHNNYQILNIDKVTYSAIQKNYQIYNKIDMVTNSALHKSSAKSVILIR